MNPVRESKLYKSLGKEGIRVVILSVVYLIATSLLVGLRTEHWLIVVFYNLCFFGHPVTRKFILAFTIFLLFGVVYDTMKAFPNYLVHPVDISSIYHFEKHWFGIHTGNQVLTPGEFFAQHHGTLPDILSGLFYINWMPVPLAFALYLLLKNKRQYLHFAFTFFLVNLIGFAIYYIHPAAPPWYVSNYGFILHMDIPGNTAGLARFDQLIHFPLFGSIYSRNSNVFAALPSLHSAYPVVVLFYGLKQKLGWVNWLLALFMTGIWFSAVYSGHHYVTDVISGILCALAGIAIYEKIIRRQGWYVKFIDRYEEALK